MAISPILENVQIRNYQGRYQVQLEIPSWSTLTDRDIERIGSLASWDTNPNGNVSGYEGGRSVLVPRSISIVRKSLELSALQISGIGYKKIEFAQTQSPGSVVGSYDEGEFFPPSKNNFMDSLKGTTLMTTSYSEGGVEHKPRPGYRAYGTYLYPELVDKIQKTNEVSQFDLETMVTPQVEAYGRFLDNDLKNQNGPFGFMVFSVPGTNTERASQELKNKLLELVSLGANTPQAYFGLWLVSQGLILPLISGLRELHDKQRIAHLQTHMSNYYVVHGIPYLMDWSTSRRLGDNRQDNIFNRTVDVKRPRENFQQLSTSFLGRFVSPETIEQTSHLVMESTLEVYSGDISREIIMGDLVDRGKQVFGPNVKEFEVILQWMKDQGLEGYSKYEYPQSKRPHIPQLTPEQIFMRLQQNPLPTKNQTLRNSQPKIGRNSPCSCGSGKKFKKCCGKH